MEALARTWSVRKLIHRCSKRPADVVAWQEFVRRFHTGIKRSVSSILRLAESDGFNQRPTEEIIDHLVDNVYRKLVENQSAALRLVTCTTTSAMNGYLLLISIKVVQDYFQPARNVSSHYAARKPKATDRFPWAIEVSANHTMAQSA